MWYRVGYGARDVQLALAWLADVQTLDALADLERDIDPYAFQRFSGLLRKKFDEKLNYLIESGGC